jgi:hypothetical protein
MWAQDNCESHHLTVPHQVLLRDESCLSSYHSFFSQGTICSITQRTLHARPCSLQGSAAVVYARANVSSLRGLRVTTGAVHMPLRWRWPPTVSSTPHSPQALKKKRGRQSWGRRFVLKNMANCCCLSWLRASLGRITSSSRRANTEPQLMRLWQFGLGVGAVLDC